jgi:hypothetical protein
VPRITNPTEADHAYAALVRFQTMFNDPVHVSAGEARLAEQDRIRHGAIYAPELVDPEAKTVFSHMLCLRFMVEVCGITYEAAEKAMIADLRARYEDGSYDFTPKEGATSDIVASDLMRMGAVEALFSARLYNEAAKGSPWASFWNEVVRLVRTRRFVPLDSGIDAPY